MNKSWFGRNVSREEKFFLLFLLVYAVALLSGLGRFGLVGPDEPRYAEIARSMFVSGDYVSPRLSGLLWFEKPILYYWMAAGSYHLFGVSEFAARLPSAFWGMLSAVAIFFTLRRFSVRWAVASAVVLSTSAMWMGFSYAASTDMGLSSTLCLAMLFGFAASAGQGRSRSVLWALCAAATALAMLAKGLIGVFLVLAILTIYRVLSRRRLFANPQEVFAVALAFLAVAATWYAPVLWRHGSVFYDEFFINQHFKRYLTPKFSHIQPVYFYAFIVLVGSIPWMGFLLSAARGLRQLAPRQNDRDALMTLAWIWFLLPVVFFSISSSKLPSYILPSFPALAIVLGGEIERLWNGDRDRWLQAGAWLNMLLVTILGVTGLLLRHKQSFFSGVTEMLYIGFIVLGLGAMLALWRGRTSLRMADNRVERSRFAPEMFGKNFVGAFAPAAVIVVTMTAVVWMFPRLSRDFTRAEYAKRVASQLRPQEKIAFYLQGRQYVHVFYSRGRVVYYQNGAPIQGISSGDDLALDSRAELLRVLQVMRRQGQDSLVILTNEMYEPALRRDSALFTQFLAQRKDLRAYRVSLTAPLTSAQRR